MAGTRKSTRQLTAKKSVDYGESSSSPEPRPSKAKGAKSTRRKRARDEDAADVKNLPSPKRPAKAAKPTKKAPAAKPTPTSSSNRDADGNQETYWLLKAEPLPRYENGVNVAFSIDDLRDCKDPEPWGGVRNIQARNNMMAMKQGDLAFFYHSNAKPSGIVGIMKIVKEAEPDETAFDPKDPYYDAKSDRDSPKWHCVSVEFVEKFNDIVDLHKLKSFAANGGPLENMQLVKLSRLSVCKVTQMEWEFILELADRKSVGEKA